MEDSPIYASPACWCRNCDHAAKAGLSPLERIRAGSRFIVCPDCGNKRCPKGTNHALACTNSNEAGQPGSEWENVKPCPKSEAIAPPAPLHRAPGLLSAPQLDALAHALEEERQGCDAEPASPLGYWPTAVAGLLGHVEVLGARAAEAEAQVAMLKVELGEQEKEKLLMVLDSKSLNKRLHEALDALGGMYCQYTPGKFGHDWMSAGEDAQDVLGFEHLLDEEYNFIGIGPAPEA